MSRLALVPSARGGPRHVTLLLRGAGYEFMASVKKINISVKKNYFGN